MNVGRSEVDTALVDVSDGFEEHEDVVGKHLILRVHVEKRHEITLADAVGGKNKLCKRSVGDVFATLNAKRLETCLGVGAFDVDFAAFIIGVDGDLFSGAEALNIEEHLIGERTIIVPLLVLDETLFEA